MTLCLHDGQIYVGKHQQPTGMSATEFDGYLGSGSELQLKIKDLGAHKFIRTVYSQHSTEEEALLCERELIRKLSLNSELSLLNVSQGAWSGSIRQKTSSRQKLRRDINKTKVALQRERACLEYATAGGDASTTIYSQKIELLEYELQLLIGEDM